MSEVNEGKRYVFEFSGDFVECVIAPLPKDKAEQWLGRDGEALFKEAFGRDADNLADDGSHFGRASELPGARFLEGCELNHGSLEVRNSDGEKIAAFDLEDDEFRSDYIDDVQHIDPDTHLLDGGPTLITRAYYSGSAIYEPQAGADSLEEAGWYVIVTDMGGEPFISTVNFENEDVPAQGDGSFSHHEVWLLMPDAEGNVRKLHHSATPERN